MSGLSSARQQWIKDACRRVSSATGWTIAFRSEINWNCPSTRNSSTLYLERISDAAICVARMPHDEREQQWQQIRQQVHLLAEFIKRILVLEDSNGREQITDKRLHRVMRELSRKSLPEVAIPRLLELACELGKMDGAALFLLDNAGRALQLRLKTGSCELALAECSRTLAGNSPDLQALVKGPLEVRRDDHRQNHIWLPDESAQAICLPIRIGTEPLGTLWCFRNQINRIGRPTLDLLKLLGGILASDLERLALLEESLERRRLRKEVHAASLAQSRIGDSSECNKRSLQVVQRSVSREEVGGDLLQLIELDATRTAIVLGDATGDGIPGALIRAKAEGVLRHALRQTHALLEPTDVLMQSLNQSLCELLDGDQFFSLFLGIWNQSTGELSCTNAGHPPPILIRGGQITELNSHGMLLGILESSDYERSNLKLWKDDLLVLFSDGISEAIANSRFGSLRGLIQETLKTQKKPETQDLFDLVWNCAIEHGVTPDDRSLMVLRMTGVARGMFVRFDRGEIKTTSRLAEQSEPADRVNEYH